MQMWSPGSERACLGLYLGDRHGRASQGGWHTSWSPFRGRRLALREHPGVARDGTRRSGEGRGGRWGSARLRGGMF